MARVRFTQDFDYKPTWAVTIAYEAGREYTVKRECAEQAIALGRAVEIDRSSQAADAEPEAETAGDGEE